MPKHELHEHGHDHKPKPKHDGPGPKERELATELTVAVLDATAFNDKSIDEVIVATEAVYRRMLALVGPAGPRP